MVQTLSQFIATLDSRDARAVAADIAAHKARKAEHAALIRYETARVQAAKMEGGARIYERMRPLDIIRARVAAGLERVG